MPKRTVTFTQAKARFVHRFTMDHVPAWAAKPNERGDHYAPQFRSDREWYDNTKFAGEPGFPFGSRETCCFTSGQTWPLGKWLARPYGR